MCRARWCSFRCQTAEHGSCVKDTGKSGRFQAGERESGLVLGRSSWLPCGGWTRVGRQAGSPGKAGVGNPRREELWGKEEGADIKDNQEAEWDMGLIGCMGGRLLAQGPGLWLEEKTVGPTLRQESRRKCIFGEILRQVWDLVGMGIPGDIQEEVSRTLWGSRSRAKRRA